MDTIKGFYTFLLSKETIYNILLSLLSSLVTFLVAVIFRLRFPDVSILLFWKQFSHQLKIVASEVKLSFDPQLRAGEQPSLLLQGEVAGLGEILHFFRTKCKAIPQIVSLSDEADFDAVKDENLFIVGGPKYNRAARAFLQEISGELFYQFKRLLQSERIKANDPQLKVLVGKNAKYPNYTYDFHEEIQFASIIFRKNLYNSGKAVLFVGGLSNVSTLAGVTWILSRPFPFWLRARKQRKGFQAIIKCRVIGQVQASKIEVVFYQELS